MVSFDINVTNVNDHRPKFVNSTYTFFIKEDDSYVGNVKVSYDSVIGK